jgi:hypothetical protein
VSDFDEAVVELKRAVEVAHDVIARGERGTNAEGFVEKVLSEIAEKTKRNDFDGGSRVVDDALADLDRREAEQRATRVALLEAGVRQDTLRRDAVAVAGRIKALVTAQQPAERPAWLPEFREQYKTYYEDGKVRGINFSLSVAIELARLMLATARDRTERVTAANLLGIAVGLLAVDTKKDFTDTVSAWEDIRKTVPSGGLQTLNHQAKLDAMRLALRKMEFFAACINYEVYDFDIFYRIAGNWFLQQYERIKSYIEISTGYSDLKKLYSKVRDTRGGGGEVEIE